jgi:hypothetical protein
MHDESQLNETLTTMRTHMPVQVCCYPESGHLSQANAAPLRHANGPPEATLAARSFLKGHMPWQACYSLQPSLRLASGVCDVRVQEFETHLLEQIIQLLYTYVCTSPDERHSVPFECFI